MTGPDVCLEGGCEQGDGEGRSLSALVALGAARSSSERAYVPVCERAGGRDADAGGSRPLPSHAPGEPAYEAFEVGVRSLWGAAGDGALKAPERNELRARAGGGEVRRAMFNGATMISQPIRKRGADGRRREKRCKSGDIRRGVKEQLR
jgi:hypothetical protein